MSDTAEIIPFPRPSEGTLSSLSEGDRLKLAQLRALHDQARMMVDTITMRRTGFDQRAYVSSPLLEVAKTVCGQMALEVATAMRELEGRAGPLGGGR